jgi:alkylhydroperoxidase family enzyme
MARIRSLEGRQAGLLGMAVQKVFRLTLGRELNPAKVQAHAPRALLSSFVSNAMLGSGKWCIGRDLAQLVRIRVAALNGCPF